MHAALILRAVDTHWSLRHTELPHIPTAWDRRGLFQLQPTSAYFRLKVDKKKYINIRRHQFPVAPADVSVVWGAQGDQWHAVVADMERPPHTDKSVHWLACYVMLSRAKTLDGLLFLRLAQRVDLTRGAPQYLIDEIDRLLLLEQASVSRLKDFVETLKCQVPQATLDLFF